MFLVKINLKIHLESLELNSYFLKIICKHFFDRFASFLVFNENFGFEQNTNQSLWSQINGMILG